jgi:DNA polymerase III epsilon subunit-like protein
MENAFIFDIETDSINATKIHCLSYYDLNTGKIVSLTSYSEMTAFLLDPTKILIGHNICRFDIPVLERLLGIKILCKLIDTLALSWTLFPKQKLHGLAEWGEVFGVPKPKVDSFLGISEEKQRVIDYFEYLHPKIKT